MKDSKKMTKPKVSWTRPPPGYKRFTTYVEEKLLAKVRKMAEQEHKTLAAIVNRAIRELGKK
jgi:hypothetical protein